MSLTVQAILAMLPVITIMAIMLVFRWSAARSGVIGLFATVLLSWLVCGFGSDEYGNIGTVAAMGVYPPLAAPNATRGKAGFYN